MLNAIFQTNPYIYIYIYMYIMYPPIRNYDLLMILPSKNRDLTNGEPVSLAEN